MLSNQERNEFERLLKAASVIGAKGWQTPRGEYCIRPIYRGDFPQPVREWLSGRGFSASDYGHWVIYTRRQQP
jgi:hypothetical protein